ncbi:MAG: tRNA (adenosine(37)-N6)-threonylcarbamoyltransferase complex transferase subunit TsaD [Alphaproteobacteria bacterium GM202ARS2]|nr:tRNA (adenosine(37)-N6)-threonylcarbamoyltransferase complex transferase subunit TsaD [Alphaproteobacteria bacterium GM202ARS2]
MIVLGIETSCDETSAALVACDDSGESGAGGEVLADALWSQREHQRWGGVVPEVAARAHAHYLAPTVQRVFQQANLSWRDIDCIAVTAGPGLIGGLVVGVCYGQALSIASGKPFMAVNHLAAHALSVRLNVPCRFPYLLLLVSGGHCQLLCVESAGSFRLYGTTRDDAVGEAFDKVARMLDLDWPLGPHLEMCAREGNPEAYPLPQAFVGAQHCDFSFAGLKSAVRRKVEAQPPQTDKEKADMAASFQRTAIAMLCDRSARAMERFQRDYPSKQPYRFVAAGGVAANGALRQALGGLCAEHGFQLHVPPMELCTDNAVMVAWAGIERMRESGDNSRGVGGSPFDAIGLSAHPRLPLV